MPINNGYEKRTTDDIFESSATELLNQEPDANPRAEATYTYALLYAHAATLAENQEVSLQQVYNAAYVQDATGEELTKKARNLGVVRKDPRKATGVVTFSRSSAATTDYTIPSGTVVETLAEDPVKFETTETVTLTNGTTSVDANIEAVEGGSDGNVGADAIQSMPSPPTGVDEVTNDDPTGDPTLTDTDGDPLVAGRDREEDNELRQRVLDIDASKEGPSGNGIELALSNTEDVISSHAKTNQTNSTVDGLDPYHTEVIVYGGNTYDVAVTLYETMSVTAVMRLQAGVNGTKETETVHSDLLEQDVTIPITRPTQVTFDLDVDVVHTGNYAGDTDVKNAVIDYTGGTHPDDSVAVGLDMGENLLVNEIENRVEDVQGVDYANVTLLDKDGDGTDDTTTDSDGVPILSIADSEVAHPDADDFTLNTTAR